MQQDSLVQEVTVINLTEVGRLVDGDEATVWYRGDLTEAGVIIEGLYNKRVEFRGQPPASGWLLKDWMELYPRDLELIAKSRRKA